MVDSFEDGRIESLDPEQLQDLISELREKILHEIAQSRYHYELAIAADKKKERCENRLSELGLGYGPSKGDKVHWTRRINE